MPLTVTASEGMLGPDPDDPDPPDEPDPEPPEPDPVEPEPEPPEPDPEPPEPEPDPDEPEPLEPEPDEPEPPEPDEPDPEPLEPEPDEPDPDEPEPEPPEPDPDEPEPAEFDPDPPDAAPAFTIPAVHAVRKKKERLKSPRRNCERWYFIDSPTESSQRSRRSSAAASWHTSNSLYLCAHDTRRRGCVVLFAASACTLSWLRHFKARQSCNLVGTHQSTSSGLATKGCHSAISSEVIRS